MVYLAGGQASVFDCMIKCNLAALNQVCGEFLELGTRKRVIQVQRPSVGSGDEGQIDLGLRNLGKLNLGLLGSFTKPLNCHLVFTEVHAMVSLEGVH
ncbi:unannotated protein [freshwater metagenome]|uniref:Unannotated protein n=1 Tax=freshwater metagenome TaxID=449393 RepID=A0A6J7SIU3_9ZZZZ